MTTTTPQNRAAWLDNPNTPIRVGPTETPIPEPNEVLIKVHAIAINPADVGRQSMGLFNASHPWIFGSDLAGTVQATGSDVTSFKTGDRVTVLASEFNTHKTTDAAFQEYMKTSIDNVCRIPDSMSFTDACVLPLGLSTAAGMVFETESLNLRYPMSKSELAKFSPPSPPEVVTVWGGSSSVGAGAIQMLRAAGYRVIGVGSARNDPLMKECGADECFDYTNGDMVEKLCVFVKDKGWVSTGIVAAAGFLPPGPVAEDTRKRCGELAVGLGGKKFVSTCLARGFMPVPEMPEGVQGSNVLGISEEPVREAIWTKWMEGALETGLLKALPSPKVVGEGLESVNDALEVARGGVSGSKVVVKIC